MKLQELGIKPSYKRLNRVNESRFGVGIKFDNMTMDKAQKLSRSLSENLQSLRRTYGAHTAEKSPKYMELLMLREGLTRWVEERHERMLSESELGKSEAILAAKDIVDTIQDMMEDIGRMQNEQLPALIDTIRDQVGSPEADAFKNSVTPLLQTLFQNIQSAREEADSAARALAGESVQSPMAMGGEPDMGADLGAGEPALPGLGGAEPPAGDEFAATDAAAGGEENLGREKR
jgi:hypothetical protein